MGPLPLYQFKVLYSAAVEARRYERMMAEYREKPLLARIFSFPPRNPVPQFKDSREALETAGEALRAVFPKLSGYVPGNENPGQYRVGIDLSLDSDDRPLLKLKVEDRVNHVESTLFREFDPEYGMVPAYQHRSDPTQNAANLRYAASLEKRLEAPVLRGVYDEYFLLLDCFNQPMPSVDRNRIDSALGPLEKYRNENRSETRGNILSGTRDIFGVVDAADFVLKENWRKAVIKECLDRPSLSTKEVRRDFDVVDSTLREYRSSGQLLRDSYIESVAVHQSSARPSLNDLYLRSSIVSTASADPNFYLGQECALYGYSKEDVVGYLTGKGKSAEGVSEGFDREVVLFNTAVADRENLTTGSLVSQLSSLQQDMNRQFQESLSSLIGKRREEGEKIGDIARDMAELGITRSDFKAAVSRNELLLNDDWDRIDLAFNAVLREKSDRGNKQEELEKSRVMNETVLVEKTVGLKDSEKDYQEARKRIKEELDLCNRMGNEPDKTLIAGITGYFCGVKGIEVESMTRALKDEGIISRNDTLVAYDNYRQGQDDKEESIIEDEVLEKGQEKTRTVGIKR